MIRKIVVRKHINNWEIHHVIWHNGSVFLKLFLKYFIILLSLLLVFVALERYIIWQYLDWLFAGIWFLVFVKFCIDFLNIYLDSLILTDTGVVFYLREWLLEYKTESFDRDKVETISHNQNWIWDKLFFKWDILLRLEHGLEFPFENVSNPKKQASKILRYKWRFLNWKKDSNSEILDQNNQKFGILVEALWEVVKDYMDKWSKQDDYDEEYYDEDEY